MFKSAIQVTSKAIFIHVKHLSISILHVAICIQNYASDVSSMNVGLDNSKSKNSSLRTFTWTIECPPDVCIAWFSSSDAIATKLKPRKSWWALALGGIPGESAKNTLVSMFYKFYKYLRKFIIKNKL